MNYNFTYLAKAIEAIGNEDLDFENYKSPFCYFSLTEDFDLEGLFEKELKLNILSAGNEANKNDLIAYYLTELNEVYYKLKIVYNEIRDINFAEITKKQEFQNECYEFHLNIYNIIQYTCTQFNISFRDISERLGHTNLTEIDSSISIYADLNEFINNSFVTMKKYYQSTIHMSFYTSLFENINLYDFNEICDQTIYKQVINEFNKSINPLHDIIPIKCLKCIILVPRAVADNPFFDEITKIKIMKSFYEIMIQYDIILFQDAIRNQFNQVYNELKSIEAITTKVPNELYDKFFKLSSSEFTDTSATDLFDKLITGDYVDIDSKRDFIKVFTGKSINKKIIWKKHLGDLKSLIKYLIEYNLLKSSKNKWLTTASIFTLTDNVDFTNKQIAETKITKNDYTISKLLDSLKIHSKS
jgi:hypothetical protein